MPEAFLVIAANSKGMCHIGPFSTEAEAKAYAEARVAYDTTARVVPLTAPILSPLEEGQQAEKFTGTDDLHKDPNDPTFGDYNIPPGGNHP